YSCINCIRTLPFVTRWYDTYKDQGFVVVGVHTPEFEFEKKAENVADAIDRYAIHYPVVQDNDYGTWRVYHNRYWPAHYLIDAEGNIREKHFGEGEYDETEAAIRSLLAEMGASAETGSISLADVPDETPRVSLTPETYLGLARLKRFDSPESPVAGVSTYTSPKTLWLNHFSYSGLWMLDNENATAFSEASLLIRFHAGKAFLVLSPPISGLGNVRVLLNGKLIGREYAGADVRDGIVPVDSSRLYELVDLHGETGDYMLQLDFETPGTSAYAFTFGE
ncbi:MAG: redoxin domain-containing protein, partial [Bdellovibrionales bacterium]|nr:redoxin domain-containing protein [Bdellovibrionales bacterium]